MKEIENDLIMLSGNVGRILENTQLPLVFYTLHSYCPNIPLVHYNTIMARDLFSIS